MCRLCETKGPDGDAKHGLCIDCLARNLAMHPCKCNMVAMHGTMLLPSGAMVFAEEVWNPRGTRKTYGTLTAFQARLLKNKKHLHCDSKD